MNLTANEKKAATARQRRYVLLLAVMLVLLFIIIVLSFWVGYYPLTPVQVLNAFLSKFGKVSLIFDIKLTNRFIEKYNYENSTNYLFALKFFL